MYLSYDCYNTHHSTLNDFGNTNPCQTTTNPNEREQYIPWNVMLLDIEPMACT